MLKNIKTLENTLAILTAVIVPVLVLPVFSDFDSTPKLIALAGLVALAIAAKAAEIIASQKMEVSLSNFDLPVLIIALAYLAAGIFKSPAKLEAFFYPGTATVIAAGALFYFLVNQGGDKLKKLTTRAFIISALITSLFSLLVVTGLNQKLTFLPEILKAKNSSLSGGYLTTFLFLVINIPLALETVVKEQKLAQKIVWSISLLIISMATAANIYQILPGKDTAPKLPPLKISWEIAIDSIKDSPFFGVGAGNYLTAFNRFRPISYNLTDVWGTKFTTAYNFYLHLLTETGLLGLLGLILLFLAAWRIFFSPEKKEKNETQEQEDEINFGKIALGLALVSLLFGGPAIPILLIFFFLLALTGETRKITFNFEAVHKDQSQPSLVASFLVGLPLIVGVLVFFYFGAKTVSAEYTFKKSLDAVARNDGQTAFNEMVKAIQKNPRVGRYHASFAQLNFLIAQNIAQNPADGKEVSETEKNNISQLIQQAVTEGKSAVSLNPTRADNWELLGNLYKQIMAFAQGSDQFAIQALSQAVALDPINPNLRISLGGVYFAIGDYDNAIDAFKIAVAAKPDLANAHYNLAVSYREKGELDKALVEMKATSDLLEKDSQDWQIVQKELSDLESKKKTQEETKAQTQGGESLTPPQKTESVVTPPIQLPENVQPPSPVAQPSVENQPTPEPSPTEQTNPTASPTPTPPTH